MGSLSTFLVLRNRADLQLKANFIANGIFGFVRRLGSSVHLAPCPTMTVGSGSCDVQLLRMKVHQAGLVQLDGFALTFALVFHIFYV